MKKIEKLEQLKRTISLLVKNEKKLQEASDKYSDMDVFTQTQSKLANASDRLNLLCEERERLQDELHADLVDCGFTSLNEKEHYETRMITRQAGLGHRIEIKYTPKRPKIVQDYIKYGSWDID